MIWIARSVPGNAYSMRTFSLDRGMFLAMIVPTLEAGIQSMPGGHKYSAYFFPFLLGCLGQGFCSCVLRCL